MKVLGLSGSMRKNGNTAILVGEILKRCEDGGVKTEFVSLGRDEDPPLPWLREMQGEEVVRDRER